MIADNRPKVSQTEHLQVYREIHLTGLDAQLDRGCPTESSARSGVSPIHLTLLDAQLDTPVQLPLTGLVAPVPARPSLPNRWHATFPSSRSNQTATIGT